MSFAALEESRQQATPANLFYFKWGVATEAFYAFTNADRSITYAGVTYTPAPISTEDFQASGTLDKQSLSLELPRDNPIAVLLRGFPPSATVALTIRQGHVADPDVDWPIVWIGRLLGTSLEGSVCKLGCEPITTSLKRVGLRRLWLRQCGVQLYGPQCQASLAAASSNHIPDSFTTDTVTLPNGWTSPENALNYRGGVCKWSGAGGEEARTIINVTGDRVLLLNGPTTGLSGGEAVTVALGCSHVLTLSEGQLTGDCKTLHNNINNFDGAPWIPTENPVGLSNNLFY